MNLLTGLSIYMEVGVLTLRSLHLVSIIVIQFPSFCHLERSEDELLRTLSEKSREHKEEWMFSRSFLPTVVWMTIGSMVMETSSLVYVWQNALFFSMENCSFAILIQLIIRKGSLWLNGSSPIREAIFAFQKTGRYCIILHQRPI